MKDAAKPSQKPQEVPWVIDKDLEAPATEKAAEVQEREYGEQPVPVPKVQKVQKLARTRKTLAKKRGQKDGSFLEAETEQMAKMQSLGVKDCLEAQCRNAEDERGTILGQVLESAECDRQRTLLKEFDAAWEDPFLRGVFRQNILSSQLAFKEKVEALEALECYVL